jgi:hypothetical protein
MRVTIGIKIFGIAVGLLSLMAVVALLSMRMTRTVDDQLVIIDHNYSPAYVALAQANIRSVEESAYARRLLLAIAERRDSTKLDDLRRQIANAGKDSDEQIAAARQHVNEQIADPLDFDDNIALARLDVRIESLQEERRHYESVLAKLLAAAEVYNRAQVSELLAELNDRRDDFDGKIDAARNEMRRLAGAAIVGTHNASATFPGGTKGSQTRRWREMDSNPRSPEGESAAVDECYTVQRQARSGTPTVYGHALEPRSHRDPFESIAERKTTASADRGWQCRDHGATVRAMSFRLKEGEDCVDLERP